MAEEMFLAMYVDLREFWYFIAHIYGIFLYLLRVFGLKKFCVHNFEVQLVYSSSTPEETTAVTNIFKLLTWFFQLKEKCLNMW